MILNSMLNLIVRKIMDEPIFLVRIPMVLLKKEHEKRVSFL